MKYKSGCKINLNLFITGILPNGYHTLDSLFLPLPMPYDELFVGKTKTGIELTCNVQGIDLKKNTIVKAYDVFCEKTGYSGGIKVDLHKNIPMGAGLGGGSGNAALILRYLYHTWQGSKLKENQAIEQQEFDFLLPLAVKIGADVPFFLLNKPVRARGIGDELELADISFIKDMWLLLLCPSIHSDTSLAYREFDKENKEDTHFLKLIASQSLTREDNTAIKLFVVSVNHFIVNDLEKPVFTSIPQLNTMKEECFRLGANACSMSGSGSSLFAIFRCKEEMEKALKSFDQKSIRAFGLQLT